MKNEKKKILVIDDSRMIRETIRFALEVNGFNVLTAKDGEEGLFIAEKEQPDEIVMDWNMPKLDGKALVKKLQLGEQTKDIPIIVMSASSKSELGESDESINTKGYFQKDSFVLERLVSALHNQVPVLV